MEELLSKHFFGFESICILIPKIKKKHLENFIKNNITANSHVTVILHSTSTSRGEVLFRTRRHFLSAGCRKDLDIIKILLVFIR